MWSPKLVVYNEYTSPAALSLFQLKQLQALSLTSLRRLSFQNKSERYIHGSSLFD
jgi:hypothetical protein